VCVVSAVLKAEGAKCRVAAKTGKGKAAAELVEGLPAVGPGAPIKQDFVDDVIVMPLQLALLLAHADIPLHL